MEQCAAYAENYSRRQSFGGSSDSMLSGSQSVSYQYAVSRTCSQCTRVCASAYVPHVDRIVLATRFRDLLRSPRVFRYEIIATVRHTKLLLRDSALKYISLISWLPDMIWAGRSVIECRRGSLKIRSRTSQTSVHKSFLSTFMSIFYYTSLFLINAFITLYCVY